MAAPRTGLLGKKLGMSQVFNEQGNRVGVTVVHAGKCVVLSKRTPDKHGYVAVQIGYGDVKPRNSTIPIIGHDAKAGSGPKRAHSEFRVDAKDLAERGADNLLDVARAEIAGHAPGAKLDGFVGDLANPADAAKLVAAFPDVDILVNNLGIFEPKPFEEIPDADWQRFFDVNVLSGVRLARAYLPGMK